ncbi:MAG: helix-turn-helix transcriptional regulator [Planctomycetes bacterium]|nr:helix-turn-helix transcriptional regulator [Planctomycetota bacterium]
MKSTRKQSKPVSVVAANLVALRKARGWTQQQFADRIGTDLSKIARTEVGILKASIELVEQVIETCHVTADDLFRKTASFTPKQVETQQLLDDIRALNDKQRAAVRSLVTALLNKQFVKVISGPMPVEGPGIDNA